MTKTNVAIIPLIAPSQSELEVVARQRIKAVVARVLRERAQYTNTWLVIVGSGRYAGLLCAALASSFANPAPIGEVEPSRRTFITPLGVALQEQAGQDRLYVRWAKRPGMFQKGKGYSAAALRAVG